MIRGQLCKVIPCCAQICIVKQHAVDYTRGDPQVYRQFFGLFQLGTQIGDADASQLK